MCYPSGYVVVNKNIYILDYSTFSLFSHYQFSDYDVTEIYNVLIRQIAEANNLILADVYSAEIGVDWIIDIDHCHPNDLGHRIIANRVFEAIVRNCSFVASTMPKETLIGKFGEQYGNGPDMPSR